MKLVFIYIIKIYQNSIGIFFRGSCRFHPTCSEYMKNAIEKYGVYKGVTKGIVRLSKCHPYSNQYGTDEV